MCLLIDLNLDNETYDELEYQTGRLVNLSGCVLGIPNESSPFCIKRSLPNEPFDHHHDSFEVRVDIDHGGGDQYVSNNATNYSTELYNNIGYKVKNLIGIMKAKLERVGKKGERFKDELLLTLVGVSGQNVMQGMGSANAVVASCNCVAFVLLLIGLLTRSKSGSGLGSSRSCVWVGNVLVLVGVSVSVACPVMAMGMTMKIFHGVGGYFLSLVCLLPIVVGALT